LGTRKRVVPAPAFKAGDLETSTYFFGNRKGYRRQRGSLGEFSSLQGTQVTESETHAGWNGRKSGVFNGDTGGLFYSQKRYVVDKFNHDVHLHWEVDMDSSQGKIGDYTGSMLPLSPTDMHFPPSSNSGSDELDELGSIAIARCSPTSPIVDLTSAIGEIVKEGIPKLLGSVLGTWGQMTHRERRKAIGDEYLNYQFGWKPLADDLGKTAAIIVDHDAIISQYERDSGKMVRRRYVFPDVTSYRKVDDWGPPWNPWCSPPVSSDMYDIWAPNTGRVVLTHEMVRKTWFSGAFSYYLPSRDGSLKTDMARQVILAKKAYGLTVTPESIWNLTPWSWAIDWFTNAGDVLRNFSAFQIDGQVLMYGYIMQHTVDKYHYTFYGNHQFRGNHRPPPITLVTETKIRKQAQPYGFGISFDGLSTFQKSIIAALGLSKGGKK